METVQALAVLLIGVAVPLYVVWFIRKTWDTL